MANVLYVVDGERVAVEVGLGESLAEAGVEADLDILHNCGFNGKCTTCRGRILEGERFLSSFSDAEREQLSEKGVAGGFRLTCQCVVEGEGRVVVEYKPL